MEVRAFSDAVYLEDQDMWHMAGIYRDVTLRVEPRCALLDAQVIADCDGSLRITAETRGGDAVRARLWTAKRCWPRARRPPAKC